MAMLGVLPERWGWSGDGAVLSACGRAACDCAVAAVRRVPLSVY